MKFLSALSVVLFLAYPSATFAQQPTSTEPELVDLSKAVSVFGNEVMAKPEDLVSCVEHYEFNSTPVSISGALSEVSAGNELAFVGTIANENDYAIPDASLWVKVVRARASQKDRNGPDIVDWFRVVGHIDLPAKGSVPFSGTWNVPRGITNGDYQMVTFVTSSDRFEFHGLTFTDDVVGLGYRFRVVGGSDQFVGFAKDGVTVGDSSYAFAAFPPRVYGTASIPVVARIVNNREMPLKGTISWKLYSWDQIEEGHLINQKTEEVSIQPKGATTMDYEIADTDHGVYYLEGTLTSSDGVKSMIGVRATRDGINTPRIHFLGLDPDESNKGTAVACFHSTGYAPTENGKVELMVYRTGLIGSLLNLAGPLVDANYEGRIATEIYGLAVPVDASQSLTLTATIWQNGTRVDSVTVPYCAKTCATSSNPLIIVIAGFIGLLVIGLIVLLTRRALRSSPTPSNNPPYAS